MRKIKISALPALLVVLLSLFITEVSHSETAPSKVFRFHSPTEPASLDPLLMQTSEAVYILHNVMRGLLRYTNEDGLVNEGAKRCTWITKLKLECELKNGLTWSDKTPVVAADYVRAFTRFVNSKSRSPAVELLQNIKSAVAIQGGQAKLESLGIRAPGLRLLTFEFVKPDADFLFKLASSFMVPVKSETFPAREKSSETVVNGPYKVVSWLVGRRIRLEPNLAYKGGSPDRPPVEILFVDDDETAFNLYERGELNFLRRLPITSVAKAKSRADFLQIPIARFDYIGFGTELNQQPKLREALAHSLDFNEMQRLLDTLGTPGCSGLPTRLMLKEEPCLTFDLDRAKKAFNEVPVSIRTRRIKLAFSKLGGDDVKKQAEWLQAQWKKYLGLTIDLEQSEQGVYLAKLREKPPAIFRKGMTLERPTCLAALETFKKNGSENFPRFENETYDGIVRSLEAGSLTETAQKTLCTQGLSALLTDDRLIPLGRIHFTLLVRPEFRGWSLNEMNQLDLAQLKSPR